MSTPEPLKIAFYLARHGAEATFRFPNRDAYDKAKAALDKIAVGRSASSELPPRYAHVTDLYFIDTNEHEAFLDILKQTIG